MKFLCVNIVFHSKLIPCNVPFTEDAGCNCYLNQFVRSVGGVTGNAGQGDRDSGFVQFSSLFLKGKILYTPDNNVTRYIIQQVRF